MTMTDSEVIVGSIWRENNKRFDRFVKVVSIDYDAQKAQIAQCNRDDGWVSKITTWAKLSRFGKGYEFAPPK